ncbi:MAG: DUF4080 domain-containing protein [Campylobacterales bacterium]|nr:DUF4080 domain-containing protein [Campylobacterales bacterium]
MQELQEKTAILEYVINEKVQELALDILKHKPKIVGIGVYIWNASDVAELVHILKKVSPQTIVVLGGPEVSYEPFRVNYDLADYIIQGEGEEQFYTLCKKILNSQTIQKRIHPPVMVDVSNLVLPYEYYDQNDIDHRHIYVEASRGCPYNCEFCLSSIDKKVRNFDIDILLQELQKLWDRGARNFKFIDRTFNLDIESSIKILDFFLEKQEHYTTHFEVIPDNFPPSLREKIAKFKPTTLQLEVGIQTLKKDIAKNIKRNLNIPKIVENIQFLENQTHAHIHLDLIIGLPGESIESFGENLDYLCSISKSEIQVGVLKKLSGTTINRHDEIFAMVYTDYPPYDILCNNQISFEQMQHMKRFARYWDLVYNSGNFMKTFQMITHNKSVFETFDQLTSYIYQNTYSTWQISLDRLAQFLFDFGIDRLLLDRQMLGKTLVEDIFSVSGRKLPKFLREFNEMKLNYEEAKIDSKNKRQLKRV